MGISISMLVSKAVPQGQWEAVYFEALELARNMELACIMKKDILGQSVYCLAPVEEESEDGKTYWNVCSDLNTRESAEWCAIPKVLCDHPVKDDLDIVIHRALDRELISAEGTEDVTRHLWGNKTQGHFYHLGMLAIGSLFQERLGNHAFVYGDINAGQCRRAVEMANRYLKDPIQVPSQAELGRWIERVSALPVPETDRVRIAFDMFIGAKKAEFGDAMRVAFSPESITEYWRQAFDGYDMNVVGYTSVLKSYLSMGFGIRDLCGIVSFTSSKGEDQREMFIRSLLDSKMHWKEKDCSDWMVQDPEDPALYGVEALFVRVFAIGARNKKVDRYIPMEELRAALKEEICDFDVDAVIGDYLANESSMEDRSVDVNRVMNQARDDLGKRADEYDIPIAEYLPDYVAGGTLAPDVEKLIRGIMEFWHTTVCQSDDYKRIMAMPRDEKLGWLAYQSRHFPSMTAEEWQRIMESADSGLERYCGLFCIKLNSSSITEAVRTLAINDALYEYGMGLIEKGDRMDDGAGIAESGARG